MPLPARLPRPWSLPRRAAALGLALLVALPSGGCGPLGDGDGANRVEPGLTAPAGPPVGVADTVRLDWPVRGAWLAPREGAPLDGPGTVEAVQAMAAAGLDHVALGVDVWMPELAEPTLEWGADDGEVAAAVAAIRAAGLAVVLVPRIESPAFFQPPYPFRADIDFPTQGEWDRFFADFGAMLVHYAQFSQRLGVAGMGLGLEMLQAVAPRHEAAWRGVIARVRERFRGWLTYSANWYREYEQVPFWDALDAIGIGAYFEAVPDARAAAADRAEIAAGWDRILDGLAAFSARQGRPVLFTEVGFPGYAHAAARPWKWAGVPADTPVSWERQATAYGGLLQAARDRPWLRGFLLWRYHTTTEGIARWEYALRGRPAEDVLRRALSDTGQR